MSIASLFINNFRNIQSAELTLAAKGINLIYGDNGGGKTSILECIHYLGLGRSFRSSIASKLINHSSEKFLLSSQIVSEGLQSFPMGAERDRSGNTRVRLAEKDITSLADLAYLLPLRIINSQSHNLFELGPLYRRKFLDWGLFYHQEKFLFCWKQFERVLKQRNTALRERRTKNEIDVWTEEFLNYALQLHQLRIDYVERLSPYLQLASQELLDLDNIQIEYYSGWNKKLSLEQALTKSYFEELRFGHTQQGPHRADLGLLVGDASVKHFLSRGQQKLLICAMIVAQGMLMQASENKGLIYLIDDLPAELDSTSRQRLIQLLAKQPSQIFITAIEEEMISSSLKNDVVPVKVFHVEHGKISNARHE